MSDADVHTWVELQCNVSASCFSYVMMCMNCARLHSFTCTITFCPNAEPGFIAHLAVYVFLLLVAAILLQCKHQSGKIQHLMLGFKRGLKRLCRLDVERHGMIVCKGNAADGHAGRFTRHEVAFSLCPLVM